MLLDASAITNANLISAIVNCVCPACGGASGVRKVSFNAGENAEKVGGWSGTTHVQFTEKHDERRIPAKSVATETEPPGNR